uniref:Uncharacterized protein MANES_03G014100 n=1 Tax=Rhizophora mucronata TaxID=61149 RepID=A0A2P2IJL9_RHIMU
MADPLKSLSSPPFTINLSFSFSSPLGEMNTGSTGSLEELDAIEDISALSLSISLCFSLFGSFDFFWASIKFRGILKCQLNNYRR